MQLNPLLTVNLEISLCIQNGKILLFNPGCWNIRDTTSFSQDFGDLFDIAAGAIDVPVNLEPVTRAQLIYLYSDAAVQVKLVPQGGNLAGTYPMTLTPGLPSLLSFKDIVEIYFSNPTAASTKVLIHGVGVM